ncbi:odorant receptor 46a [Leptinotarsa decemlineata]|uniref:odorant receptor 46a n=1 Tax=Leptinotarsa decemlineata TaxID=7539 RepID=UPI003D30631D
MSDIMEAISIPKQVLTITGHWPEKKPSIFKRVLFFLDILFSFSLLLELVNHFDDFEALSKHLSLTISPTSYLIKLIIFKCKSYAFLDLIALMKVKEFKHYPKHLRSITDHAVRSLIFLGNGYLLICFITILMYCLIPAISKADLPVKFSYYLGEFKPAMYAFQVMGLISASTNNSCLDMLAMSLMGICAAQIEVLNRTIISLNDCDESGMYRSDQVNRGLKNCVKHHVKIIRFHEILEKVFSMIILMQYATSAAVICNIGFQLVHVDPMSMQLIPILVYFIAMMIQLAIYCWFGNEIIVKSLDIRDSCYNFKWFESDLKARKTITIIMERSKKPMLLTAGKFSVLSLQSYTSVMRTSYSYFALLQTLYSKNQN